MNGAIEAAQFELGSRQDTIFYVDRHNTAYTSAYSLCPVFYSLYDGYNHQQGAKGKDEFTNNVDLIGEDIEEGAKYVDDKFNFVENVIVVDAS